MEGKAGLCPQVYWPFWVRICQCLIPALFLECGNWNKDCSVTEHPKSLVRLCPSLPSPSLYLKETTSCPGRVMLSLRR